MPHPLATTVPGKNNEIYEPAFNCGHLEVLHFSSVELSLTVKRL
jgi:hypothetical protein